MSGPSDPHGPSSVASGAYPAVQVVQPPAPPQPTTAIEAWLVGETQAIRRDVSTVLATIGHSGDPVRGIQPEGIAGALAKLIEADKVTLTEEAALRREAAAREAGRRATLSTAATIVGLLLGLITLAGIVGAFILRGLGAAH